MTEVDDLSATVPGGHPNEPNALRALTTMAHERSLPMPVEELLALAYEVHSDPWEGYKLVKAATEQPFTGVKFPSSALRSRLGLPRSAPSTSDPRDSRDNVTGSALTSGNDGFGDVTGDVTNARVSRVQAWLAERDPQPLKGPAVPAFPAQVLPPWAARMVTAVSEAMQTPVDLPGLTLLAVLATCAAGRAEVQVRSGWRETLSLYVAAAAESSERKSPVLRVMAEPLRSAERILAEQAAGDRAQLELEHEVRAQKASEARAIAVKSGGDDPAAMVAAIEAQALADAISVPPPPRLIAGGDATPEAIVQLLVRYGRIAIMDTEGGLFDLLAGRHSNGVSNLDAVLQAYSGDPIATERRGRDPEAVTRPALVLGLMIQPVTLVRVFRDRDMTGRGLTARFLYSVPEPMVGRRRTGVEVDPIPDTVRSAYLDRVERLATGLQAHADQPATLHFAPDALDRVYAFEAAIERRIGPKGDLRPTGAWGGKLVGQAIRLCGLLHLAEHGASGVDAPIEATTVTSATALADHFAAHALAAFTAPTGAGETSDAAEALAKIRENKIETFTVRDLHRKLRSSRFTQSSAVRAAVDVLEEAHWVARLDPTGRVYTVHPRLLDRDNDGSVTPPVTPA